jgi:predicted  nucleic acid-binding Zn-ribbon protein
MCKHKLALLRGDSKMLYDQTQKKLLQEVLASKAYPALKSRLDAYELELAETEREMAKLKEREKKLKTEFAYELTHGRRRR